QHLPWPRGQDASHVQLRVVADGVVLELPSRAREVPETAQSRWIGRRPGFQHGICAADQEQARRYSWCGKAVNQPGRAWHVLKAGEPCPLGTRYHELQYLPSLMGGPADFGRLNRTRSVTEDLHEFEKIF